MIVWLTLFFVFAYKCLAYYDTWKSCLHFQNGLEGIHVLVIVLPRLTFGSKQTDMKHSDLSIDLLNFFSSRLENNFLNMEKTSTCLSFVDRDQKPEF